jgi:hypothetical protein
VVRIDDHVTIIRGGEDIYIRLYITISDLVPYDGTELHHRDSIKGCDPRARGKFLRYRECIIYSLDPEVAEVARVDTNFRWINRVIKKLARKVVATKTTFPSKEFLTRKRFWKYRLPKRVQRAASSKSRVCCP